MLNWLRKLLCGQPAQSAKRLTYTEEAPAEELLRVAPDGALLVTDKVALLDLGFRVTASFPFQDSHQELDACLEGAAGLHADFGGVWLAVGVVNAGRRELSWTVATFRIARNLKRSLEGTETPGLRVTIREL